MRSFLLSLLVFLLIVLSATPAAADGVSVQYSVTNLGSGTWEYDYTLQGSFLANWGVAVYFPTPGYGEPITDLGTGGSDWTTFAFQPDPSIPAPGEFDVVALIDNPSLTSMFGVTFLWSQPGMPGAQAFDLFDFTNGAELISSGTTSPAAPAVPEPSSLLLFLAAGLSCLAVLVARRAL